MQYAVNKNLKEFGPLKFSVGWGGGGVETGGRAFKLKRTISSSISFRLRHTRVLKNFLLIWWIKTTKKRIPTFWNTLEILFGITGKVTKNRLLAWVINLTSISGILKPTHTDHPCRPTCKSPLLVEIHNIGTLRRLREHECLSLRKTCWVLRFY